MKEKIKKLLRLSESSNKNEAQNALLFAQKLMAKHGLTQEEIDSKTKRDVVDIKTKHTVCSLWRRQLGQLIAQNFRCMQFGQKQGFNYSFIAFIGIKEDVIFVAEIFEKTIEIVKYLAKKDRASLKPFATGFVYGLKKKFEDEKRRAQFGNGLNLVLMSELPEVVKEATDDFKKGRKSEAKAPPIDEDFKAGFEAGQAHELKNNILKSA